MFSVPEVINNFEIIGIISVSLTDMYANVQKLTIIIIITLTITINKKNIIIQYFTMKLTAQCYFVAIML